MIPVFRIRGFIKLLSKQDRVFGIIEGDDLREYFFIPSYLREPAGFQSLTEHVPVEFTPRSTIRGMRAWNVSVLSLPEKPNGEEARAHP